MLVVALVNHPRVQFQHGKQGTLQQKAAVKAHGHVHHDFSAVHEAAIAKKSFKSVTKGSLAQATSSEKVKVRLYMESKCPACKKFTGRYVSQLLEAQGMSNIVDFKFVPWGNGQIVKDGVTYNTTEQLTSLIEQTKGADGVRRVKGLNFFCQHGGAECGGNAYESCVQHLYPSQELFFPVLDCIESRGCAEGEEPGKGCDGAPVVVAPACIRDHGPTMDASKISDCVYGPLGAQLLIANALDTASLQPAKEWVPWVTVDGKHLGQTDPAHVFLLGKTVCDTWAANGGSRPEGCSSFPDKVPTNPYPAAQLHAPHHA